MVSISTTEKDVLSIAGDIDMHESPRLKQTLDPLIANKADRLILDFTGVSYIDSSGLALFIDAMQRIQAYGGKLALCGLRENVRKIFELARLDQIFSIYSDKKAAVEAA